MKPLFFVHTPFQMYVAQQIIAQEKFTDVVFILGFLGNNRSFYKAYDLMLSDVPFNYKSIVKDDVSGMFVIYSRRYFNGIYTTYKNKRFIDKIIKENNIDKVFLGDSANITYRLLIYYLSKKNMPVCIFEEGTMHYQDAIALRMVCGSKIKRIVANLTDYIFYLPFWKVKYGNEMFGIKYNSFDKLPISHRYSILDKYHTDRDLRLKISSLNNSCVKEYILKDLPKDITNKRLSLFLSEPLYSDICGDEKIYLDIIKETAQKDNETDLFLIKYHPREKEEIREKIENIFKDLGKPYKVLTADIPLPVELYFEYLSPQKLVLFMTSTYLYAPQIAPNTKVQMLIQEYANRCRMAGYNMTRLDHIMSNLGL